MRKGEKEAGRLVAAVVPHADLAMKAARRMARTRSKVKVGHEVCHHLLRMLDGEFVSSAAETSAKRGEATDQYSLGF